MHNKCKQKPLMLKQSSTIPCRDRNDPPFLRHRQAQPFRRQNSFKSAVANRLSDRLATREIPESACHFVSDKNFFHLPGGKHARIIVS